MISKLCFFISILVLGLTQTAHAQHAELDAQEVRSSSQAYAKAIRFRRIDRDVLYFDPTQPPPPLETGQFVPRISPQEADQKDTDLTITGGRTVILLIASSIFLGVTYLVVVYGGRVSFSFAANPTNETTRTRHPETTSRLDARSPFSVEAALQMNNRRQALVVLCKCLLARVMAQEGVLQQDSWTDRDTLQRVPQKLAQREALQTLVYASEKVQFGGRDVSEEEFDEHVARLRTLWAASSA
ncbi:MAG: DUF4129 domain-containing protein [Roseobacter sp.]